MTEQQAKEMIDLLKEISSNTRKILENTNNVDNSSYGRDDLYNKLSDIDRTIRIDLISAINDLETP